jgi:hypothetical protein
VLGERAGEGLAALTMFELGGRRSVCMACDMAHPFRFVDAVVYAPAIFAVSGTIDKTGAFVPHCPMPELSQPITIKLLALPETTASILYSFYEVLASFEPMWAKLTGSGPIAATFERGSFRRSRRCSAPAAASPSSRTSPSRSTPSRRHHRADVYIPPRTIPVAAGPKPPTG